MSMFHWYGFFIGVAIVSGLSVAEKIEPKVNKIAPWLIILGIIGARIYHVVDYAEYYSQNLGKILMLWEGGLSIWGGLIVGILTIWIYFKGSSLKVMGALATALPLSQAIGRVGNGVSHEFINLVFGIPWWGAEAILDLILFGAMWMVPIKWRVFAYLVGYGLIRLVLQPYRL